MNEATIVDTTIEPLRSKRLKSATSNTHDNLDLSIMTEKPFSSRDRYGQFVKMQYFFHRDIDGLYNSPTLDALLPDLQGRRRFDLIVQDLQDLEIEVPVTTTEPIFVSGTEVELPVALGWLYVAEGSNLGAAFLLKEVQQLDLSAEFGARHLAAAPEGRGLHWRTFIEALDNIVLSEAEEIQVIEAAKQAFQRVHMLVQEQFA